MFAVSFVSVGGWEEERRGDESRELGGGLLTDAALGGTTLPELVTSQPLGRPA